MILAKRELKVFDVIGNLGGSVWGHGSIRSGKKTGNYLEIFGKNHLKVHASSEFLFFVWKMKER